MNALLHSLDRVMPWPDWAALAFFFLAWLGYARFAHRRHARQPSLLVAMNRIRRQWMLQATYREVRMIDGSVMQNLATSPSFFASTSILIIGGILAVLGASDQAGRLVDQIPFAARTSALLVDIKLMLLAGIFTFAFFSFTWSMRQYTFGAQMVAAVPETRQIEALPEPEAKALREAFADRAGAVIGMAAESFNDGMRAYYMSFAVVGWFFSPLVFAVATALFVSVLYRREFHSDVLKLVRGA